MPTARSWEKHLSCAKCKKYPKTMVYICRKCDKYYHLGCAKVHTSRNDSSDVALCTGPVERLEDPELHRIRAEFEEMKRSEKPPQRKKPRRTRAEEVQARVEDNETMDKVMRFADNFENGDKIKAYIADAVRDAVREEVRAIKKEMRKEYNEGWKEIKRSIQELRDAIVSDPRMQDSQQESQEDPNYYTME